MSLQCFIWGGKELKSWNYGDIWTWECHVGLQGEARVKISYPYSCLLHNTMAFLWLWQYHDRWEEEAGLTGVLLVLIDLPVNPKPCLALGFTKASCQGGVVAPSPWDWPGSRVFISHRGASGWAGHACANPKEHSGKERKPHHDLCMNIWISFFGLQENWVLISRQW